MSSNDAYSAHTPVLDVLMLVAKTVICITVIPTAVLYNAVEWAIRRCVSV